MLIGIAGRKGVGKDTCGGFLVSMHNYRRESFADPLKDTVSLLFGYERKSLDDAVFKETPDVNGVTPRKLLQVVGTELFRDELPKHVPQVGNIWLECMRRRVQANRNAGINTVITDVRFADEARLVVEMGGRVINVLRNTESTDSHSSEAIDIPAELITYTIDNNGDLSSLFNRVNDIVNHYFKWTIS